MSIYTVAEARKKKDVEGRHGAMQVIELKLSGADAGDGVLAEWFTKATTALPDSGSTLEGTLENDPQYGYKFKKAQQNGGFSGPRPEDPARAKRILRQHSQDMGLQTLTLARQSGIAPTFETVNDIVKAVKALADVYDRDAEGAAA